LKEEVGDSAENPIVVEEEEEVTWSQGDKEAVEKMVGNCKLQ
jgi:hypothetical protein